jgi:hypothetical protein
MQRQGPWHVQMLFKLMYDVLQSESSWHKSSTSPEPTGVSLVSSTSACWSEVMADAARDSTPRTLRCVGHCNYVAFTPRGNNL